MNFFISLFILPSVQDCNYVFIWNSCLRDITEWERPILSPFCIMDKRTELKTSGYRPELDASFFSMHVICTGRFKAELDTFGLTLVRNTAGYRPEPDANPFFLPMHLICTGRLQAKLDLVWFEVGLTLIRQYVVCSTHWFYLFPFFSLGISVLKVEISLT